jgi:tetratricopeptide (TPR) repeat protein
MRRYAIEMADISDESQQRSMNFLKAQDLYRRGLQLIKTKKFKEASEQFNQAAEIYPDAKEYRFYSDYALLRGALEADDKGTAAHYLSQLKDASIQNPSMDVIHLLVGHSHAALGDQAAAKDAYKNALSINPDYKEAMNAIEVLGRVDFNKAKKGAVAKGAGSALKKIGTIGAVVLIGAGILLFVNYKMQYDPDIVLIEPENFYAHFSDTVKVRQKSEIAKLYLSEGSIDALSEDDFNTRCLGALEVAQTYGIKKLFILEENIGLKGTCAHGRVRRF